MDNNYDEVWNALIDKCDKLIGLSIDIRGEDYGRLMSWAKVVIDDDDYIVFTTSLGKKVEAVSLIYYLEHQVYYPTGSDQVFARRRARGVNRGGRPAFGQSVSNRAWFPKTGESINITRREN
jgi:hypothetical protein